MTKGPRCVIILMLKSFKSGISDTESECGNASDRGYTTDDNETHQTEIINMVSYRMSKTL